jgi:UDP-N-acetylmuramate dehydrogenase
VNAIDTLVTRGGGRIEEHAPFGARTTYRVGGSARLWVNLSSLADLRELADLMIETGLEWVCVGNGSNLLVNDGERDVLAVHLIGELAELSWHDDEASVVVNAGAGLDLPIAARRLSGEGVVGFEWAVGVPGTFGGAVTMNAGGHGSDIEACLEEATLWRHGALETWSKEQLALGYRTSAVGSSDLVVSASLRLVRGDAEVSKERLSEVVRWRRENQPGGANAGSVFRNPPGDHAARLIEAAGCKGLRVASAQVSEKHANFIQADADGSAKDVFDLMELVRTRVMEDSGVSLISENRFVGFEVTP